MCRGRWQRSEGPEEDAATALLALTPSYDEGQHASYVVHLEAALKDRRLRNIALTGNYGIGKSSILDALRQKRRRRVLSLSLPTLGDTPIEQSEAGDQRAEATSLTNRIQKEIVKQLLYREVPSKVPHSRYRRLGRFRVWREAMVTALFLVGLGALLALLGLLPPVIGSDAPTGSDVRSWTVWLLPYGGVLALATILVTWIRKLVSSRWSVSEVSAAGTSVSLTSSETYFDKYLDEIVYFFEVTRADVVIFEDIDRFDDPHIFETLRELNTLLNGIKQLKGRSIRFIYAIKDSIFEQIGQDTAAADGVDAADLELTRANRTKFFDLVIPVVPFITHRSARDLMATVFAKAPSNPVSTDLVDLAAKHITDMRLIKNIFNEFVVFSARLLDANTGVPGLKPDALLAMLIYKNIHLSDFERVSRGNSNLDALYRQSRQVANETISRLGRRVREIETSIASEDHKIERAKLLGARLKEYFDRVARHVKANYIAQAYVVNNARSFTQDELLSPDFWDLITEDGADLRVTVGYANQAASSLNCSLDDLRAVLGDPFDPKTWAASNREQLLAERDEVRKKIEFVRHADMADLMTSSDFKATVDGKEQSFGDLAQGALSSRIALDLLQGGYIDRNFTLYVSQYYGVRVSADVMNFIVHNVQPGIADPHYPFPTSAAIDALLKEVGEDFLAEPSAYNLQLVDHLAAGGDERLRPIIANLVRLQEADRAFLDAYLQGGVHRESFIAKTASLWTGTFRYLVEEANVTDAVRTVLVGAALARGSDDINYDFGDNAGERVGHYISENAAGMRCLTDPAAAATATNAISVLRGIGQRLEDISVLSPAVRRLVVDEDLYVLTVQNLRAALDLEEGSLALDRIRAIDPGVYRRCLDGLDRYASIVDTDSETPHSIENREEFTLVLADLENHRHVSSESIGSLIRQAAPDCRVEVLSEVPQATWPQLLNSNRVPATFGNVRAYIDHVARVDGNLAKLLGAAAGITDIQGVPEDAKRALAVAVLDASDVLPDAQVRVAVVDSLDLEEWINPSLITCESGVLLSLLLEHKLIADSSAAFERFHDAGWAAIELAIERSDSFASHVSPGIINEDWLSALFESHRVSDPIKRLILSALEDYTPACRVDALTAAARYAIRESVQIGVAALQRMAGAGVEPSDMVRLLAKAEPSLSDDDLISILGAMPDPYRTLARSGSGKKVSVPNDWAHGQVVRRLQRLNVVRSHRRKALDPTQMSVTIS